MKTFLVTGAAGFIASKTIELLLTSGHRVIGIDNMNDYYSLTLKRRHLKPLKKSPSFSFYKVDIENKVRLQRLFKQYHFDAILNLAAQVGVRHSIKNPDIYFSTNLLGTINLLKLANDYSVKKFVLASSSSLYAGHHLPFKETLPVHTPICPYAASKKDAEAACGIYHRLYGIDITILRYFTVYGPAGRPDMSVFSFIKKIDDGRPITVFGNGTQSRDFTYVDDIAKGTIKALKKTGFKIINLGDNSPHTVNYLISLIEKHLGKKAVIKNAPAHLADMKNTWADTREAQKTLRWTPRISLEAGIQKTVAWYLENKRWLRQI